MENLKTGQPRCIVPSGDVCGEGILWDQESGCLYWTDINRFLVHRYALSDGAVKTWFFLEPVTCVMKTSRKDTLALSLGSGIGLWQPASDAPPNMLFTLPGYPFVRCNDAAVDPGGDLWVGSMRNNVRENGESMPGGGRDGVLYCVNGAGTVSQWRDGLGISNTLLWSPDKSTFYFGDSDQNCIWSYDYNQTRHSIDGERPFLQNFERGKPDGSAIDKYGYIWNCRYDGGCIVRAAPDGTIDRVIEVPVGRPTNCAFGGFDGSTLYITSASPAAGHWERFGGGLFALETNVTAVDENRMKLD